MLKLTWPQVLALRLQRHFLEQRAQRGDLLEVTSRICGLQAQVMSSAELAVWARIDGLESDDVSTALWEKRTLVKTWAMRGTLHLLTAADFPLYVAALRAFRHFRRGSWLKYHGVTMNELDALLDGVQTTLTGDGMTREQLADALAQHTKQPKLRELLLSGWGALLKPAAFQGHIAFGPSSGQNVTFVSPRRWLGDLDDHETDAARLETLRRYLAAYGPATPDDFSRWWGAEPSDAKKLFRALGDALVQVSIDGWDAWALQSDVDALQDAQPSKAVNLLPGFDPYTLGLWRDCTYALPAEYKARVFRPQGWISPVVLDGGCVVAVWNYEVKKSRLLVTVEPFEPLTQYTRTGIEQEAARFGIYLEAEPAVSYANESTL